MFFFGFMETTFHDLDYGVHDHVRSRRFQLLRYLGGGRLLLMFYQRLIDSRRWGLMTLHRQMQTPCGNEDWMFMTEHGERCLEADSRAMCGNIGTPNSSTRHFPSYQMNDVEGAGGSHGTTFAMALSRQVGVYRFLGTF